jgi:predicted RNA-binding Zn ribbon-like protein
MNATAQESNEVIDGFLFVANRPILDFLNTKPVLKNGPTELLTDGHDLERWLIASGMAISPKTKSLLRRWRSMPETTAFLKELITFREKLRSAVVKIEGGSLPSDSFLAEVNTRLLQYPLPTSLNRRGGQILREAFFEPHKPSDLWPLFIDAAANLLSETATSRLRKCESCVLHFFDTSKKGSRRWCSMNFCGNKLKVAAYQQRRRTGDLKDE